MSLTRPFTTQIVGHEVAEHIYVKGDGRTVCASTDRDVDCLLYAKGSRITEAQKAALIFPGAVAAPEVEPVPDADRRSAESVPDAEQRGNRRRR